MNLRPVLLGQKPYIRCVVAVAKIQDRCRLAEDRKRHEQRVADISTMDAPDGLARDFNRSERTHYRSLLLRYPPWRAAQIIQKRRERK